jgi:lipopolysaccharide heptosyltransferase I
VNILIVKLSALGDVIHTLPALTTLRRHQPSARITWLIEETAAEIVAGHPALDRLLVWRRRHWVRQARTGRWLALARDIRAFLRELRDTRYDLVLDFQALAKAALWIAFARGARKAGYGPGMRHDEFSWLALNERVPVADPNAHAVERNLRLIECLGFPRLPLRFDLPVLPEAEAEADRLLAGAGITPGAAFVAINPMTRWPTKNWTPGQFAAVARGLSGHGLTPLFTGAANDRPAIDAIATTLPYPPARTDGLTRLPTLAALFRRARVVLATDTGPMHLAVAVGTPVVALFGPTAPGYTGPYGSEHIVLRVDLECSPCLKRTCATTRYETHACMRRLDPAAVVAAVLRQAGARPQPE